jgi:aminocarboxymuconate-semialdehyde decarboxylase
MIGALPWLRFRGDGSLEEPGVALDVHAHVLPVEALRLAGFPGISWDEKDATLSIDGHRVGIRDLYFPERLLSWMDENAIERALISVPPPAYRQHLAPEAAADWAKCLNHGLLQIAQRYPDRLMAMLHLPIEHPDIALELLHWVDLEAIAGFALAAGGVADNDLGSGACLPIWEALDAANAFVFLHPAGCCDERLRGFYLENLIGNPYETTVAAAQMVMAEVPARYPSIRFCLAHAGGFLPAVCGRLQHGQRTARPGVPLEIEAPLDSARRLFVDCIGHHPASLDLARTIVGPSHVLFGSDWPFPMGIRPSEVRISPVSQSASPD